MIHSFTTSTARLQARREPWTPAPSLQPSSARRPVHLRGTSVVPSAHLETALATAAAVPAAAAAAAAPLAAAQPLGDLSGTGLFELVNQANDLVAAQLVGLTPLSFAIVLGAGLLTSLSPCTLSVLPLTIGARPRVRPA